MVQRRRIREKVLFHLDVSRDEDLLVAEEIDALKRRRRFLPSFKEAIMLYQDLKAGRVGLLRELFPWVFDAIASHLDAERDARADAIQAQLERLEALLLEQGSQPAPAPPGPQLLEAPQFAAPQFAT